MIPPFWSANKWSSFELTNFCKQDGFGISDLGELFQAEIHLEFVPLFLQHEGHFWGRGGQCGRRRYCCCHRVNKSRTRVFGRTWVGSNWDECRDPGLWDRPWRSCQPMTRCVLGECDYVYVQNSGIEKHSHQGTFQGDEINRGDKNMKPETPEFDWETHHGKQRCSNEALIRGLISSTKKHSSNSNCKMPNYGDTLNSRSIQAPDETERPRLRGIFHLVILISCLLK